MLPFFRNLAIRDFRSHLNAVIDEGPFDRIDIVAHSFGTYLAVGALSDLGRPDSIRIHTAILCSNVLPPDRNLSQLIGPERPIGRLVNDCAIQDRVLPLTLLVYGVGMGGQLGLHGFQGKYLTNRFFNFGHSGYFEGDATDNNSFMKRWWLPLLQSDGTVEQVDQRSESPSWLNRILGTLGENGAVVALSIYLVVGGIIGSSLGYLYNDAKKQRVEAVQQRDRAQRILDYPRKSAGISLPYWGDTPQKNKCYYYGDGGYNISVSDDYLKRYQEKGFSLNSLCMALVSGIRFDPETGQELPTYFAIDLKYADDALDDALKEVEPVEGTEILPKEIPNCFHRGLPYSDCVMKFDPFTGRKYTLEARQAFKELGHALENLLTSAIDKGIACGFHCPPREKLGEQEFEELVKDRLAREGNVYDLIAELSDQNSALPRRLEKISLATFYDISNTFPLGFGYALRADGTAILRSLPTELFPILYGTKENQ